MSLKISLTKGKSDSKGPSNEQVEAGGGCQHIEDRERRFKLTSRYLLPFISPAAQKPWPTWMSNIPNDVSVPTLTIPGTHDSAAYPYSWPFVATQKLDFEQQLNAGIRYFDMRCGLRKDVLEMVHGPTILGVTLSSVLKIMYKWLQEHPSEGIIVQIKKDRKSERSTMRFSTAILQIISIEIMRWRILRTPPHMGELRGKIQLFRRFTGSDLDMFGLDVTRWVDNPEVPFTIYTPEGGQITIQDHYTVNVPEPLPSLVANKEANINALLNRADRETDPWHWFINFTSAFEINFYYQIPPRSIAAGAYWGFRRERGINLRLRAKLATLDRSSKHRLGIVAMDFPEQGAGDLIQALIMTNFALRRSRRHVIMILTVLLAAFMILAVTLSWIDLKIFVPVDIRCWLKDLTT